MAPEIAYLNGEKFSTRRRKTSADRVKMSREISRFDLPW